LTKIARKLKVPQRTLSLDIDTPVTGKSLRSIAFDMISSWCQGVFHFATYNGLDYFGGADPSFLDQSYVTKVKPSPNAEYLEIIALIQPVSLDGQIQFLDETTTYNFIDGGYTSHLPNRITVIKWYWEIENPGDEVEIYLSLDRANLLRGWLVRDYPLSALSDTDTGWIDASMLYRGATLNVTTLKEIHDSQVDYYTGIRKTYVNNQGPADTIPLFTHTADGTFRNIIDPTETAYSADTPGYWFKPKANKSSEGTILTVTCEIRGSSTTGTGQIQFETSLGSSGPITLDTTIGWQSTTIDIYVPSFYDARYTSKIDIHSKDTGLGTNNINSIIIYS